MIKAIAIILSPFPFPSLDWNIRLPILSPLLSLLLYFLSLCLPPSSPVLCSPSIHFAIGRPHYRFIKTIVITLFPQPWPLHPVLCQWKLISCAHFLLLGIFMGLVHIFLNPHELPISIEWWRVTVSSCSAPCRWLSFSPWHIRVQNSSPGWIKAQQFLWKLCSPFESYFI